MADSAKRAIRECSAAVVWIYVLVKLLVFDIDNYLFSRFAPNFSWVLQYKAFLLLAVIAILWLALGKAFPKTALYITLYPVILLFWRLPTIAFRRWQLVIVAAPAIYRLVTTLRTTFLLYAVAILSGLATLFGADRSILILAVTALVGFICVRLLRSLRVAYSTGPFIRLADLVSKLRTHIGKGIFDGTQGRAAANAVPAGSTLYLMRQLADLLDEKVRAVAMSRKYDLCLIAGWLYTVTLTCFTFAFAYVGLQKIDPSSFRSQDGANFWAFLGFSFGAVQPGESFSGITPVSLIAKLVYHFETPGSTVLIFIILVFILLTAGREAFQRDTEVFSEEIKLTAEAIDARISQVYNMTLAQMEAVLFSGNQRPLVSAMRRMRGLPELSAPPEAGKPEPPIQNDGRANG